ncbi:MAG: hypothetical protein EXR69_00370 [Myxococcales bacterium]|nr:hypothetical protein [Myxococcales bacterium]
MTPAVWHMLLGGAFVPSGVGALAWDDADQLSGTLAGEFDGVLRPPITVYAGWFDDRNALLLDFAIVRFTTSTWADTHSFDGVGSARLGADYRRYLPSAPVGDGAGHIDMYGDLGVYGVLPAAANSSDAYTEEDQASADEASGELRARIGGVGAQFGLGAGYRIGGVAGVTLGVRGLMVIHRTQATLETGTTFGYVILPEGALTLEFRR